MPLRAGDSVTLTLNPKIRITKYDSLTPFASLTRVLREPYVEDLADATAELLRLWHRSLLRELVTLNTAYSAMGPDSSLEDLEKWCRKELGDAVEYITVTQAETKTQTSATVKIPPAVKADPVVIRKSSPGGKPSAVVYQGAKAVPRPRPKLKVTA